MPSNKQELLKSFQDALQERFTGTQNWWIKSLFHFTDIKNAISILESGKIFSREKANELNLMQNDNANDGVINITSDEHKQYARLYFGPSTPTQYNNEGIKPKALIVDNAHCPIPVMFIFDFAKVFMIEGVKFTDGNLANNPIIYEDIKDLGKLNFNLIYHRSSFSQEYRNTIVNARHSEVLVKDKLTIENNLRLIAVRSEAEKELLLYQLSDRLKEKYQNKIYVQPQTGIFVNDWIYINKVSLIGEQLHIEWHKCSSIAKCDNKYSLKIAASNHDKSIVKRLEKTQWYPQESIQKINLTQELRDIAFELTIYIDDIKAYSNKFEVSK